MSDLTDNPSELSEALTASFFNPRTVDEVMEAILQLDHPTRAFVFKRIVSIARTQPEIAYQFALQAERAIGGHGREVCQLWLQKSFDRLHTEGLHAALEVMKNLDGFILEYQRSQKGIHLNDVGGVLQNIINGLGGRALNIEPSDETYTDSETLYLPAIVDYFDDKNQNFAAYRAMLAHLWAQNYYGTWRINLKAEISNNAELLQRFHYLETLRLNACIARDFPGLWRQMQTIEQQFKDTLDLPKAWERFGRQLECDQSTVNDSLRLLEACGKLKLPPAFSYQGILKPDNVEKKRQYRLQRDKRQLQFQLAKLADEQAGLENRDIDTHSDLPERSQSKLNQLESVKSTKSSYELELNGVMVPPDAEVGGLLDSIIQDLGEIPPDYLLAVNPASYDANFKSSGEKLGDSINSQYSVQENQTYFYPEWDSRLEAHRKHWCVLREKIVAADHSSNFVNETLHKYRGHLKSLRRSFEALRDEYKILKKQPDGDSLDIEALVDAIADVRSGMEMTTRIYRKASRADRNIAVIFMVDMSSSTRGWINLAQREALVLLTEALQSLDDRYAIYGFSGMTRKRCELYAIKTFDENYDAEIKARIAAIQPQDYTRYGRHYSSLKQPAGFGTHEPNYSSPSLTENPTTPTVIVANTASKTHAWHCSKRGNRAFIRFVLPLMSRPAITYRICTVISNYVVINDVAKLPYRISEVYRGLTQN